MKIPHKQSTLSLRRLVEFEQRGRYKEALAHLEDIWEEFSVFPDVKEFEPRAAAEIILRCGALIGFHGHNEQIPNTQENSRNLLTEARTRFGVLEDTEKIAECENYLALAYWRTGESVEAETWIEEALAHDLPNSSQTRLYTFIIRCLIFLQLGKINENFVLLNSLETDFLNFGNDGLKGDFYNHFGLALRKKDKIPEALEKYKLARYFHKKSGHQVYLAAIENNLAFLYKSIGQFSKALEVIDSAIKIFKKLKDHTREGFSLDTKAQILLAEGKYKDALKTSEKAINILKKSENTAYLVESYSTKVKTLLYEDDLTEATLCLFEAVEIAKTKISEAAAKNLINEYEAALREKNSAVIKEIFAEKESDDEKLELILPPEISHYSELQGIWIKNEHLEHIGLPKDSLAVVVNDKVKRGDLVAIAEIADDSVSCGFYDADFGIVCLEGINSEPQLFDEKEIRILGKIIGVCKSGKKSNGKMIVEPIHR